MNPIQVFPDFEKEIMAIDPRLTVVRNPNRKEVANIKVDGVDICPIPVNVIYDESDKNYGFVAPNGWKLPHKTRPEAIAQVKDLLEKLKNPEFYDMFFDK